MEQRIGQNEQTGEQPKQLYLPVSSSLVTNAAFEVFKGRYPNLEITRQEDEDTILLSLTGPTEEQELFRTDMEFLSRNPDLAVENICSRIDNYIPKNKTQVELKTWAQRLIDLDSSTTAAGLFVFGATGVGKTHIAVGVTKELMKRGFSANFIRAEDYQRMRSMKLDPNQAWIIDDLNSPFGGGMTFFKEVVLNAHNFGGRVFVTSNTDYYELLEHGFVTDPQEKPRYMDRTKGMFKVIHVTGESHREETAWHRSE